MRIKKCAIWTGLIKWMAISFAASFILIACLPIAAAASLSGADPTKIGSAVYTIDREKGLLSNIACGTTVDQLKSNLTCEAQNVTIYDGNGNEYASGPVATGMTVKLKTVDAVTDTLALAVLGDVNGDATIDINDILFVRSDIIGTYQFSPRQIVSSDMNFDNTIDINDILYMRAYIMGVTVSQTSKPLAGLVIGIDPGHQAQADYSQEPIAPGSTITKDKVSSGTRGVTSKVYEYEVNLIIGLKLKTALESMGATVVMTRETNDVNISNSQRAILFNQAKTDYAIRLHCNGSTDSRETGAYVLIPSKNNYLDDCKRAATLLTQAFANATGAKTYPYVERDDQAGFNYCERMIINIEMGYMTNPTEDLRLVDPAYQQKMVEGLTNGILAYFGK